MASPVLNASVSVILFDHDGTLIDSEQIHYELWADILSSHGIALTLDTYCNHLAGTPVIQNARDLVRMYELDISPEALANEKHSRLNAYLKKQAFPLMSDASAVINRLFKAGFTLGIVTGGSTKSVQKTLSENGLAGLISTVVAVEDVERSKPFPDCYQLAMARLGVHPGQCVAVEDTHHGMQAAVSAEIPCVVVPTSVSRGHDFSSAAAHFSSLSDWLDAENAAPERNILL